MARPAKSKWLRDEDDANWGGTCGKRNNMIPRSGGNNYNKEGNRHKYGGNVGDQNPGIQIINILKDKVYQNANMVGSSILSTTVYGPDEEELNGLNIIERKLMRGDPRVYDIMDTTGGLTRLKAGDTGLVGNVQNEAALSEFDCATSSTSVLAKLAKQASQSQ